MAGYHVHEKAILMVILPLAFDAVKNLAAARNFLTLSFTGHYALLPLLFTRNEYPLKVSLLIIPSECLMFRTASALRLIASESLVLIVCTLYGGRGLSSLICADGALWHLVAGQFCIGKHMYGGGGNGQGSRW